MNMYGGTGGRCCFKGAVRVIRNECASPQPQHLAATARHSARLLWGRWLEWGGVKGKCMHAWMYGIDLKQHGVGCQSDRRSPLAVRRWDD